MPTVLKQSNPNDVDSGRFLDVRLDASTTHYLIFTGIAKPNFFVDGTDQDPIPAEDVTIDLGVDVTDVLCYTATVGLASIENDDSSFIFATDSVELDAPDGHLFLKVRIALSGDSSYLNRFSYQAHVKAVIDEPIITGTIRWAKGIETHSRPAGLFTVTANLMHQDPAALGPTFEKVANGWVNVAVLKGKLYEATYTILNPPLHEDLYVIAETVPEAFVPTGNTELNVYPSYSGPHNLSGANPSATAVDFEMTAAALQS